MTMTKDDHQDLDLVSDSLEVEFDPVTVLSVEPVVVDFQLDRADQVAERFSWEKGEQTWIFRLWTFSTTSGKIFFKAFRHNCVQPMCKRWRCFGKIVENFLEKMTKKMEGQVRMNEYEPKQVENEWLLLNIWDTDPTE